MDGEFNDWHPADIFAAVKKRGKSLAALSREHGLGSSTLSNAIHRPWPRGEKLIADFLNTDPWVIWPSRYHDSITHEFIDRTKLIKARRKSK